MVCKAFWLAAWLALLLALLKALNCEAKLDIALAGRDTVTRLYCLDPISLDRFVHLVHDHVCQWTTSWHLGYLWT